MQSRARWQHLLGFVPRGGASIGGNCGTCCASWQVWQENWMKIKPRLCLNRILQQKKGNLNLPVFVASTCSELVKDLNLFLESKLFQLSRLFWAIVFLQRLFYRCLYIRFPFRFYVFQSQQLFHFSQRVLRHQQGGCNLRVEPVFVFVFRTCLCKYYLFIFCIWAKVVFATLVFEPIQEGQDQEARRGNADSHHDTLPG